MLAQSADHRKLATGAGRSWGWQLQRFVGLPTRWVRRPIPGPGPVRREARPPRYEAGALGGLGTWLFAAQSRGTAATCLSRSRSCRPASRKKKKKKKKARRVRLGQVSNNASAA